MAARRHANKVLESSIVSKILFGVIFLLILLRCLFTLDPDFGWHLTSGQYIIANGLPGTDVFTYTAANFPWIHHEWLADVFNAVFYEIGDFPLLALIYTIVWTLAIWLMVGSKHTWKAGVVILVTVIAMAQFISIRDTVWTFLLLATTHRLFNRYRIYIPALFILWANLHGGFVIGLAYVAWRIVYERQWRDTWLLPAAIAATFINPYGVMLYREIFATLLDPTLHTKINEWQRWGIDTSMIIVPTLWSIPVIYDLYKKRWRGIVRFDTFLLAASALSLRHFLLFSLFSLPRMTQFYSTLVFPKLPASKNVFTVKRVGRVFVYQSAALAVIVFFIVTLAAASVTGFQEPLTFQPEQSQPVAAVKSLRNLACKGNIFNHYDIGGYLIWKYPEQKVYIDGRMPSWELHGTNYMDDYLKVMKDDNFQKQQFDKFHITCAIVQSGSHIAKSLKEQGWKVDTEDPGGWVLLRNEAANKIAPS